MNDDSWRQIALGEEAAAYAYGVLAPRLPLGPERNRAIDLVAVHNRARDDARSALAEQDMDPNAPGAFSIPFPVDDAAAARRLAALVEWRLIDVYCAQIPDAEPQERRRCATAAAEASARAVQWGGRTAAFPGAAAGEASEPSGPATATPSGNTAPAPPVDTVPPSPAGPPQGDGASVG